MTRMAKYSCLFLLISLLLILLSSGLIHMEPVTTTHADLAAPSVTGHMVQGPPTITASLIDQILAQAQSPAQGLGAMLYQLGTEYGIDPVYALAFFHHESSYGRYGVAHVTHSLGNIRCTSGYACRDGYRMYSTWRAGAEDWYRLIDTVYIAHELTTLETIIPVYAPNADHNDERAYIASVLDDVERWQKGQV
ncbi:MAG: glucosaminidase domain-containing protein [Ktedonobacteraceae bacterium]|nr:glucosaminidase domain-containing protein [Ktedonobacteraceae bacterium]